MTKDVSWHWPKVKVHTAYIRVLSFLNHFFDLNISYILVLLSTNQGCVTTLNQGNISRSRSQNMLRQHPCPNHNFLLPCWIWTIFHTTVIRDPRVYHDLDPGSYLEESVSGPKVITAMFDIPGTSRWFTHIAVYDQGCVMTLVQGRISQVKGHSAHDTKTRIDAVILTVVLDLDDSYQWFSVTEYYM